MRRPEMEAQPEDAAEEIKRLQRCISDLVSLFALPAVWSGNAPSEIVHTLLDALLRMLQLDLVYVRLSDSGGRLPSRWFGSLLRRNKRPNRTRSAKYSNAG